MYEYFPNHYSWNLGLLMAVQLGGELTEIDQAGRPLIEVAQRPNVRDDPDAQRLWVTQWRSLGERVEALARTDEAQGHLFSAGRKYLRACVYYMTAERMAGHRDPLKLNIYGKLLETFRKGVTLRDAQLEFVDPALREHDLAGLVLSRAGRWAETCDDPFRRLRRGQGMDVPLRHRRGIRPPRHLHADGRPSRRRRCLRLQGLTTSPESERWATASMDYLETR